MPSLKEKIANHILLQNDWMKTELVGFEGNVVLIKISEIKIYFEIDSYGQIFLIDSYEKPDVSIKMNLKSLIDQITIQKMSGVNLEGNVELAKKLTEVLKKIKWDYENDLSYYIGDAAAASIAKISRSIVTNSKKNITSFAETVIEYWQEEAEILSKKTQIEKYVKQVDLISEDVDRAEQRLDLLLKGMD